MPPTITTEFSMRNVYRLFTGIAAKVSKGFQPPQGGLRFPPSSQSTPRKSCSRCARFSLESSQMKWFFWTGFVVSFFSR